MLRVFARAKSKPDCCEQLRSVLRQLMVASRREAGVVVYDVFETSSGEFLFREEYETAEAFERHRSSRHVRVAFARSAPLMDGGLDLWVAEPLGEADQRDPALPG